MQCPVCRETLRTIEYEGIEIETCDECEGEWLDHGELPKILQRREVQFDEEERRALVNATKIKGVPLKDVDRDLPCPKCGATTDAINYGGNTGIILDRCTGCKGIWFDGGELEKVQMLIEGWEETIGQDVKKHAPDLRRIERKVATSELRGRRRGFYAGFLSLISGGILDPDN